jgi:hypothetical protein
MEVTGGVKRKVTIFGHSADVYAGLRVFLSGGVGINLLLDADSRKTWFAASLCVEPRSYEPVVRDGARLSMAIWIPM